MLAYNTPNDLPNRMTGHRSCICLRQVPREVHLSPGGLRDEEGWILRGELVCQVVSPFCAAPAEGSPGDWAKLRCCPC